jgi:uncharacterized protein (DUF2147 family)
MKKNILTVLLLLFITYAFYSQNHGVTGKWKTIDDFTGEAKSIVEIYEKSGKIYGKVIEIFDVNHRNDLCHECSGVDAGKAVMGLTIIKGLSKNGKEFDSGKILDPKSGKLYKCYIVLEDTDRLKVRGYIGFSLIGRTQYWQRIKN